MIYVFPASKYSYCKLIKQSSQPIHTFFSHFCTYLFYIEGNGKEGKVHEDLVLSKMAETLMLVALAETGQMIAEEQTV